MNKNAKGFAIGGIFLGLDDHVRDLVIWVVHGLASMIPDVPGWDGFPEQSATALLVIPILLFAYRVLPQSVRTPPEPKA